MRKEYLEVCKFIEEKYNNIKEQPADANEDIIMDYMSNIFYTYQDYKKEIQKKIDNYEWITLDIMLPPEKEIVDITYIGYNNSIPYTGKAYMFNNVWYWAADIEEIYWENKAKNKDKECLTDKDCQRNDNLVKVKITAWSKTKEAYQG